MFAANEGVLLGSGPALELRLALNRVGQIHWPLHVDEPRDVVITGELRAATSSVQANPTAHIFRAADIKRPVRTCENVDQCVG